MLRRHHQLRMQVHQMLDVSLFVVAFVLAHGVRARWPLGRPVIEPFEQYFWLVLAIVPLVLLILPAQGFYNRPMAGARRHTAWSLLKSCFMVSVGLVLLMFLFREQLARSVIVYFGAISYLLVFVKEEILRWVARSPLIQSQLRRRVVLVGSAPETARLRRELARRNLDPFEVVAELDLNERPVSDLVTMLHEHSVNGVILNGSHTFFDQLEQAIQACEVEGVEAWLVADFFKTQHSRTAFDEFCGMPVMVFRTAPDVTWQALVKQMLDLVGGFLALVLLAPLMLLIALMIKLTSAGPVFFRQSRCGLNGQPFTMWKFRTMVTDAEQQKQALMKANEMSGPVFKLRRDPRVTPVGRFLRRWSLDELPQLINVVKGDMSLVGPRPLPVEEVRRFDALAHRRRLSVKPGMTGSWQVSGRNDVCDFNTWVQMDLDYIDNWSIWLDVKILAQTIPAVIGGAGAR